MTHYVKQLRLVILLIFLCILSGCSIVKTIRLVKSGELITQQPVDRSVHFDTKGHLILLEVEINNNPKLFKFVLDTGALTVIHEATAKALNLSSEVQVMGKDALGVAKEIDLVRIDRLSIGDITVKAFGAAVMDLSPISANTGLSIDGLLGSNFLSFFKLTIDYRNKLVSFSTDTSSTGGIVDGYKIRFKKDITCGFAPKIKCRIDDRFTVHAIVDTGARVTDLPISVIERLEYSKEKQLVKSIGVVGGTLHNPVRNAYLARIQSLQLGDLVVHEVPVRVVKSRHNKLLLGKAFLSHFVVTVNYPANELILVPYENDFFENNIFSTGVMLTKGENGRTLVSGFWETSPAFRSGLQLYDEVLTINSIDARNLTIADLVELDDDDCIRQFDVLMKNNQRTKRITIKKDYLLPRIPR